MHLTSERLNSNFFLQRLDTPPFAVRAAGHSMVEGESADGRLELLHGSRCSISRFQEVAVEKTREMNILKPFGLSSPYVCRSGWPQ